MTRPMTVTIQHQLGAAEARRRIAEGFSRLTDQLPGFGGARVTESWSGDRMSFTVRALGQTVDGHVDVRETAVDLEVRLPGLLGALADGLRGRLQQAGQKLLTRG